MCANRSVVVKAKNRFRDEHDSQTTAGYRNCSFIVNVMWGVASEGGGTVTRNFMCELQVDIRAFSDMKHGLNGGHSRYKQYRNVSGL